MSSLTDNKINIAIFFAREKIHELLKTFDFAVNASKLPTTIDLVINGNNDLLQDFLLNPPKSVPGHIVLRVWYIKFGDKANAWNQHIHTIWNGVDQVIYIDGYIHVDMESIQGLILNLKNHPGACGSSGVPGVGFSAKRHIARMKLEGGFNGGLCIIRNSALQELKKKNIKIPLGLYRTDGFIGSVLGFGISDIDRIWEPKKYTPVTYDAKWKMDSIFPLSWKFIKSYINRRRRQNRGRLENMILRRLVVDQGVEFSAIPCNLNQLAVLIEKEDLKSSKSNISYKEMLGFTSPVLDDLVPILKYEIGFFEN